MKKAQYFLAQQSVRISESMLEKMLLHPSTTLRNSSTQETIYDLTEGVRVIALVILGNTLTILPDLFLLILLFSGLLYISNVLAIFIIFYILVVAIVLQKVYRNRVVNLSKENTELHFLNSHKLEKITFLYRDIIISNSVSEILADYGRNRRKQMENLASITLVPINNKYFIESALMVGALGLFAVQLIFTSAENAFSILAVFIAATFRIAPAILRIQQGFNQINSGSQAASRSTRLMKEMDSFSGLKNETVEFINEFSPIIRLKDVTYQFPDAEVAHFNCINLEIGPSGVWGLIGDSGSGKSLFIDLVLGIFQPTSGQVFISDKKPGDLFRSQDNLIRYVPQEVYLFTGTVRENILFGNSKYHILDKEIFALIEKCGLNSMIQDLPEDLDTLIGPGGRVISGGQKQKIGIMRALVSNPGILLLDEPTSSLDEKSKDDILELLSSLGEKMTVLLVTHDKTSLQFVDHILRIENSTIAIYENS
jgi:ABC-type multidrug transport system fused ATPase/permease subunit